MSRYKDDFSETNNPFEMIDPAMPLLSRSAQGLASGAARRTGRQGHIFLTE